MARNLPARPTRRVPEPVRRPQQQMQRPTTRQPVPMMVNMPIPVFNPVTQQMTYMTAAELVEKERQDDILRARWNERRAVRRERERKARRFWLGFGLVLGLGFLIGAVVVGWLIWSVLGLGVLAIPIVIGLAACTALGGHRCITIVQHMH